MRNDSTLHQRALHLIQLLRQHLIEPGLAARHRRRPQDFTRERVLNFPVLMLLLLQKSLKSLQNHLHEFLWELGGRQSGAPMVSAGALSHARAKLLPGAFVELNRSAVLPTVYGAAHAALLQCWRGRRLLAVDSSLIRLPDSAELRQKHGVVQCANQHGGHESCPEARVPVLDDVLNQIALDARKPAASTQAGRVPARAHLPAIQAQDVVLADRGCAGCRRFAEVRARDAHFISRCSRASFAAAQALFARDEADVSRLVTLSAPRRAAGPVPGARLAAGIWRCASSRCVCPRVNWRCWPLRSWRRRAIRRKVLGAAYWRRRGQETFYGRLKGRLDLEHCSGQTVAAVEQDFHALILLSNVESVVLGAAQGELAAAAVLTELTQWFLHAPTRVRPGRKVARRKFSPSRSCHYQRRVRKIVF